MLNRIDLSRIDLNLLVLLGVMLEERHVGRAARRLHLSPSAVSHGLGRLRRLLNDPLFLKHPKGVVPTERALELSDPVAAILAQIGQIVASSEAFDAARSQRRFTIGAPDAVAAVVVPAALAEVRRVAPGVRVRIRDLQPNELLGALDARDIDIALYPQESDPLPARFRASLLYEERFVIAARAGHWIAADPSIDGYCAAEHLLVSRIGEDRGFVDALLEEQGRTRQVVLVVPSFLWALSVLSKSELIGMLPESLVRLHGPRFDVDAVEPPIPIRRSRICVVAPNVAMSDAGVEWLVDLLAAATRRSTGP